MKTILFECNDCFRKCKLIVDEESDYPKYCPYEMLTWKDWNEKRCYIKLPFLVGD